ncbi:hypothetical protein IJ117_00695 [Candidatus Saccharibacteria bacterium]|nr:hypothetical protein [Candidatus Saccharibacteria bacterium]
MKHKGFTLIEVALFIALTGLLFAGIVAGTGNSIEQQRFFDSTQSFAEFLRSIYSQVSNPQSISDGRGDLAIYGKMISFGQTVGLDGETLNTDEVQRIYVYDVVGDVTGTGSGSAVAMLRSLGANVARVTEMRGSTIIDMEPAGIVESYEPKWGATIETTADTDNKYKGSILIVRNPVSGTINTLVSTDVIEVNKLIYQDGNFAKANTMLQDVLAKTREADGAFVVKEVDFCVNPSGFDSINEVRWDVRLVKNARNASGVEVIDKDDLTLDDGDGVLNRCRVKN